VTKRMSHGLSFLIGYTYGHSLDNGSLNRFGPLPQDSTNLAGDFADSDFDVRHRVTFAATYDIPGIRSFSQLLDGWQINTIVTYQTPQPWGSWDAGSNISGTGEQADRWNITGDPASIFSGKNSVPYCSGFDGTLSSVTNTTTNVTCLVTTVQGNFNLTPTQTAAAINRRLGATAVNAATLNSFGCYVSANGATVLTPPALGHFGNMGRNIFRDSGYQNWDMSLFKNFKFKERFSAQFRWEVFNVLNHPTAANPYGASSLVIAGNMLQGGGPLGFAGVTPDFAAGNPLIGSGSQRVMQLGLKLSW
jgi:hypothetical protein